MLTIKIPAKKSLLLCAVLAAAGLWLLSGSLNPSVPAFARTSEGEQACLDCLHSLGWEVEPAPISTEPCDLGANIDEGYQALQSEAGFDLTPYLGCTVTRYTYAVTNYPTGETGVLAVLLVYENKVVGGDVHISSLDGFMHSLIYPV